MKRDVSQDSEAVKWDLALAREIAYYNKLLKITADEVCTGGTIHVARTVSESLSCITGMV